MVEKNCEYEVDIVDQGMSGEGIAKIEGYTTFIKGALKGEKIKTKVVKKNKDFGFGKLMKIINKSENREDAICPSFNRCGGCTLQHQTYDSQLIYKTNMVKTTLKKALGFDVNVENIIGMGIPYNYRNKAMYPVSNGKIGFYADRSHEIIENEKCFIQNEIVDKLAKDTFEILKKYKVECYDELTGKGTIKHIVTRIGVNTGELMLILVTSNNEIENIDSIIKDIKAKYPDIISIIQNINDKDTNVIMGNKCITLYGDDYIVDNLDQYKFKISPLSFYQVNLVQTEILYNVAKEYARLSGNETVFDLYCGIGTISIFMSGSCKEVYGVEIVEEAIEDARENAKLNEVRNTKFLVGEAENIVPELYETGVKADVVFVDPPRKGCDGKLLDTLVKMKTEKIIYISCNPATLARDLKYLTANNYEIKKVQPVDMFPQTYHVECVALICRK